MTLWNNLSIRYRINVYHWLFGPRADCEMSVLADLLVLVVVVDDAPSRTTINFNAVLRLSMPLIDYDIQLNAGRTPSIHDQGRNLFVNYYYSLFDLYFCTCIYTHEL